MILTKYAHVVHTHVPERSHEHKHTPLAHRWTHKVVRGKHLRFWSCSLLRCTAASIHDEITRYDAASASATLDLTGGASSAVAGTGGVCPPIERRPLMTLLAWLLRRLSRGDSPSRRASELSEAALPGVTGPGIHSAACGVCVRRAPLQG
jgi:hypothetical protein